ncbi:MAG: hypothetical protein ACM3SQ_03600 [Betaproteobacteria bacterium]
MNEMRRVNEGFDRLQRLLLAMRIGDELRAAEAAAVTGLSVEVCRTVFEGLVRVGLMAHQQGDAFVRRSLNLIAS